MTARQNIVWSIDNAIGQIMLNRPDCHNAISKPMWEDLPGVLKQLQTAGAKVVLFKGSGSSFASGADLGELVQLDSYEKAKEYWQAIASCLEFIADFPLPTVAMIHGACIGGGCLLALACDLRYASHAATFAIPVAKLGIILDAKNIAYIVSLVGPVHAKELLFLGDTISGTKAAEIGMVNAVVEPRHLESSVKQVLEQIANNAGLSIRQSKQIINAICRGKAKFANCDQLIIQSYLSQDFKSRSQRRGANI